MGSVNVEGAIQFVLDLASEHPITCDFGDGHTNACRYCSVTWCEGDFGEALAPLPGKRYGVFGFVPHDASCAWVVANQLARS